MRATSKITTVSFEGFNIPRGVFGRTVTVCVNYWKYIQLFSFECKKKHKTISITINNQILIKWVFITKKNTQTLTICLLPKISLLPGYVGPKFASGTVVATKWWHPQLLPQSPEFHKALHSHVGGAAALQTLNSF